MTWFVRFLLWVTPLTWAAHVLYPDYLQFLVRAAKVLLFVFAGARVELDSMDVLSPLDLALFAALALSSRRTRGWQRLRRLAAGCAILIVVEVACVTAGIVLFLSPLARGEGQAMARQVFAAGAGLLTWVGAPALWLALFGSRELPDLSDAFAVEAGRAPRPHGRRRGATPSEAVGESEPPTDLRSAGLR